jgi:hypothetical protein
LPACFNDLRVELEKHHGAVAGARRFVKLLQLLVDHPMARVSRAIEACRRKYLRSAEVMTQRTLMLTAHDVMPWPSPLWSIELTTMPLIQVPAPDRNCFNHLLDGASGEGLDDQGFAVAAAETHRANPTITTYFTRSSAHVRVPARSASPA